MPETPQHLQALARANEVRMGQAEVKRQITAGVISAAWVLRDPNRIMLTMRVMDLLRAQPRWGVTRSRKFLASTFNARRDRAPSVIEGKRLQDLTERERQMLASAVEEAAARRNGHATEGEADA